MAKFVIAGKAGCSSYARAELLGDTLVAQLPNFKLTKVVKSEEAWSTWLENECKQRGWSHSQGSPIIWRELVDTGGMALYIGGTEQFEKYAQQYYNISPATDVKLEEEIAIENLQTFQVQEDESQEKPPVQLMRVCLTNCTCPVAYHLAQLIATGKLLGPAQKVALHLYHHQPTSACDGLVMELQDLASSVLEYAKFSTSILEAFENVDMIYILDYPYNPNVEVKSTELVDAATLFQKYAGMLNNATSEKKVKVIVNGSYANTGTSIMALHAPSLDTTCFVAAPCLAESQAKAVLANQVKLNSSNIKQLAIWGKTHGNILADLSPTRVSQYPGAIMGPSFFDLPVNKCVFDYNWLDEEFPKLVSARHDKFEGYKDQGPHLAEAVELTKLGHNWLSGNTTHWQSVGIVSDGKPYNVPQGVTCSIPSQCKDGCWEPVSNLVLPQHIKDKLALQVDQLKSELDAATLTLDTKQ